MEVMKHKSMLQLNVSQRQSLLSVSVWATIQRPRVQFPGTASLLLNLYSNCDEKRTKINKKGPGLAHFKKLKSI